MAKLLLTTQVYENYGAHDWDGEGECPQYWKPKGGSDYVVLNVDLNRVVDIAREASAQIEQTGDYFTESVIGWEVVADDYLTTFEQDQLEFEGIIRFPAKELALGAM
jgi:hypothetical protein